jgi:hypothetical protein
MLDAMSDVARDAGLGHLIAPVRPSLKDRYPITPIGRYLEWIRANGEPFDPWVRIHVPRAPTGSRTSGSSTRSSRDAIAHSRASKRPDR